MIVADRPDPGILPGVVEEYDSAGGIESSLSLVNMNMMHASCGSFVYLSNLQTKLPDKHRRQFPGVDSTHLLFLALQRSHLGYLLVGTSTAERMMHTRALPFCDSRRQPVFFDDVSRLSPLKLDSRRQHVLLYLDMVVTSVEE